MELLGRKVNLALSQIATGKRVRVDEAAGFALVVVDPAANLVTVSQHSVVTGGTPAALNFTKLYKQDTSGVWTVATQASGNTFTPAGTEDLIVIEFKAVALDDGYKWVSAGIAVAGTLLWVLGDLAVHRAPANLRAAHSV